jgi:hypothetical protein
MKVTINEAAWQARGVPTIVEDNRVRVRLLNDHASHVWIDLQREGDCVLLAVDRSSLHRRIAEAIGASEV